MDDQSTSPVENDLHTRLHAMETKAKRMRNQRNSLSDEAKSAAEKRDGLQSQARETMDLSLIHI